MTAFIKAARGVLELECEPTRELNCEAQDSGRQLQRNAEEFGDSAIEPKRAEPLEGREECLSDIFQDALERMSALQKENEEMLESTKHERKPNDSATRQFNASSTLEESFEVGEYGLCPQGAESTWK